MGMSIVYLDSAATSQKPKEVLAAHGEFYKTSNANVHRGVHYLSARATDMYEQSRAKVAKFINAKTDREIVFTRNASEALNLVCNTWGEKNIKEGDEIVLSVAEHHSNIVPWQILCEETGARLRVAPINDEGELLLEEFERLLTSRTRLVAITHLSNALGTIVPVREVVRLAHERGIPVLLDGAQAVAHLRVDVQELDCDFYAFSGHKLYGPTGIGVLYGKAEWLEAMPPYQGGGDMISSVTFEKTTYNRLPYKFEAGTPHIAGAIGLGAAIEYVTALGLEVIAAHERDLLAYATEAVSGIPGLRLIGTAREKASILSFTLEGVHPHDIGTILDHEGIAIRAGHHCAQPIMERFGVPATARVSFALYNKREEVDALVRALEKVREVFGR